MTLPRLTYFSLRGRAEAIRLFLHAKQEEFEDHRVETAEEWATMKPTLPFGGLPVYEADGQRIHESHAILRHLHRTLDPDAPNVGLAAELDTTEEAFSESREDYWRFAWVQDYYDHLESYAEQKLRPRLQHFTDWFDRNGSGAQWWVGDRFTYVDCIAFGYLDEVDAFFPALTMDFDVLRDFCTRVASVPGIAAYLESDARPPVFGMGCMGPKIDPRVKLRAGQTFASPWMDPLDLEAFLPRQRRLSNDA